uniref:Uncharacterized protein n=1 Tax=Arundo donax TaxID=35708 RepID=A0A0A8YQZ5_ARUDO
MLCQVLTEPLYIAIASNSETLILLHYSLTSQTLRHQHRTPKFLLNHRYVPQAK